MEVVPVEHLLKELAQWIPVIDGRRRVELIDCPFAVDANVTLLDEEQVTQVPLVHAIKRRSAMRNRVRCSHSAQLVCGVCISQRTRHLAWWGNIVWRRPLGQSAHRSHPVHARL